MCPFAPLPHEVLCHCNEVATTLTLPPYSRSESSRTYVRMYICRVTQRHPTFTSPRSWTACDRPHSVLLQYSTSAVTCQLDGGTETNWR